MTDLAVLGLRVESHEVAQAEDRLDDLTRSAAQAEKGLDRLGNTARHAGHGVNSIVAQQVAIRRQFGFTAQEGLNFSRQMADIGVTAAMGMNPLMIALQQGPQLFDILQVAGARAGLGLRATFIATGAVIWTALAPILPIVAAIGLAVGAVAGTVGLAARSMNKEFGDLTVGMGLTEEQLEKVKNKGVTMGDVVVGTLKWIGDSIMNLLGPAINKIGEWFTAAMDWATRATIAANKAVVGAFLGSFRAIKAVWSNLPDVMGDVAISATNAVIRAIEAMINKAVIAYNRFLPQIRLLMAATGNVSGALGLGEMQQVSLGQMSNPYQGAAREAGRIMATEFATGMQDASDIVDRTYAGLQASIRRQAESRIRREAGEADDPATRRARQAREPKEKPEVIRLTKFEKPDIEPLRNLKLPELVDPLKLIADEMQLIDDLARDMAQGLSSAFGETGRALGDVLTVMTGYQSRMAQIDLAERERRLTAAQAARERAQAEIQSYGDMAAAARGFFKEGSDGYRALLAIEQVYRAVQLAGMIQSMVMGKKETSETVANNAAKAASGAIVAYVNAIKGLDFPLNLAAGAATIAALAAVGVKVFGGGGKGATAQQTHASQQAAASHATQSIGQAAAQTFKVEVGVNDDRFNAYVDDRARPIAQNVSSNMGRAVLDASRRAMPGFQQKQHRLGTT